MDDHIKVNKLGEVTEVIKMEGANKFFDDETGEELTLHAPNEYNNGLKYGSFEKGNCVYTCISGSEMQQFIDEAGQITRSPAPTFRELVLTLSETAYKSKKEKYADFPLKLAESYDLQYGGSGPFTEIKGTMFRLDGGNTLYNPSDAGQFLWGGWMRKNGATKFQSFIGSNANEIKHGGDSSSDQRAIYNGMDWQKLRYR